jgi:hypothetical protein
MTELKHTYDKHQTKLQRNREVRDLYKHLMKRYRSHLVHAFFNREYHISPELVNHIIASCDKVPVDAKHASAAYKAGMKENYQL